jgi:glycosyltransferase involved in cell wall biosynthesis
MTFMRGHGLRPNTEKDVIVSVLMTTHNSAHYVAEAIESILSQSLRAFNFVIVDDGSTDDTLNIVSDYARADTRIRVRALEHVGRPRALNTGLTMIDQPFVAVMDADDVSLPHRLERQLEQMIARPMLFALGGHITTISGEGRALERVLYPIGPEHVMHMLRNQHRAPIANPAAIIRTERIKRLGGYRDQFRTAQDLDVWLRASHLYELDNLDSEVLKYRVHGKNSTSRDVYRHASNHALAYTSDALRRHRQSDEHVLRDGFSLAGAAQLSLPTDEISSLAQHFVNDVASSAKAVDAPAALDAVREYVRLFAPHHQEELFSRGAAKAAVVNLRQRNLIGAMYCLTHALSRSPGVVRWAAFRAVQRLRKHVSGHA